MKRIFKVEKLPLDSLINLLIELYERGIDYVDMSSDNTDPLQDKLIIQTKDEYINASYTKDGAREDGDDPGPDDDDQEYNIVPRKPSEIETKLTDDDINDLLP